MELAGKPSPPQTWSSYLSDLYAVVRFQPAVRAADVTYVVTYFDYGY